MTEQYARSTANHPELKRVVGLSALVLYGLGTMVGGGYYALLGEVAREAGVLTPLAFGCAGLVALVNGLAFAELSSRFPVSAGEVRYVDVGFDRAWLSRLTGWLVILTGVVSAATLADATARFLQDLTGVNETVGLITVVVVLGAVAGWGVGLSVGVVTTITIVEVGALVMVGIVNAPNLSAVPDLLTQSVQPGAAVSALGIFSGSFLAFYAFIGFEDMVNMAEEVKQPGRNLPRAILIAVVLVTGLYVTVSLIALPTVDLTRLTEARTPIAELVSGHGRSSG